MPLDPERVAEYYATRDSRREGPFSGTRTSDTSRTLEDREERRAAPAQEEDEDEGGGGFFDIVGGAVGGTLDTIGSPIANAFRGVTTQEQRDTAGQFGRAFFGGEEFANVVLGGGAELLGIGNSRTRPRRNPETGALEGLGTDIYEGIGSIPVIGRPTRFVADVALNPSTLLTAGVGGVASKALRGAGPAGRVAARLVEPVTEGNIFRRVAAETSVEVAAATGAKVAADRGAPPWAQVAAGLLAGGVSVKTLDNINRSSSRVFSAEPLAQIASQQPEEKLTGLIRIGKLVNEDLNEARRRANAARFARARAARQGVRARGGDPRAALRAGRAQLQGPLPSGNLSVTKEGVTGPPQAFMTPDETVALFDTIEKHPALLRPGREAELENTMTALEKLLVGDVPQPSEIRLLQRVFGQQLGVAVNKHLPRREKLRRSILNALNSPRALQSAMDLSIPLRQGGVFGPVSRPRQWFGSWGPMLRAFASEDYAIARNADLEQRATRGLMDDSNLALRDVLEADPAFREEAFAGLYAEYVPGIRRSQFAATTFLNEQSADLFDSHLSRALRDEGLVIPARQVADKNGRAELLLEAFESGTAEQQTRVRKAMREVSGWINDGNGRANLQPNSWLTAGNALFFSPRLLISRLSLLLTAGKVAARPWAYSPVMRRAVARDMAGFFGTGFAALAMMRQAQEMGLLPGVEIEHDPRSTDFGKIKIGDTRIELWAGFQPLARYTAQMLTQSRKNAAGEIVGADSKELGIRFGRSKLAPVPSAIYDVLSGETFLGEPVDQDSFMEREAATRVAPLFLQDYLEAIEVEGSPFAALKVGPAFFGAGATSYEDALARKDRIALRERGLEWDELSATEQGVLQSEFRDELGVSDDGFTGRRLEEEDRYRQEEERSFQGALESNQSYRDLGVRLDELNRQRSAVIQAIYRDRFGDGEPDMDDPVDRFFAALNQNELAFRLRDPELADQAIEAELAAMSPEERAEVEDIREFNHDESVKWYFDAKRLIRESGYWDLRQQAMNEQRGFIEAAVPGASTYFQLTALSREQDDPVKAAMAETALKRVDKRVDRLQEDFRRRHPEVDRALQLVYGSAPVSPADISNQ